MKEKTHWLQSPNKNYLGHWDLPESGELLLTIKTAAWTEVINPTVKPNSPLRSQEKRVITFMEEGVKPWICNQGNANSILKSIQVKHMEDSTGKKILLYIGKYKDNTTKEEVDCVRVRSTPIIVNKPELTPEHKNWDKAKEAVQTGDANKESISKHWIISNENYELLCG